MTFPQVNAALKANMDSALTSSGSFSIGPVSDYLRPFISPDYLEEQSSATVLSIAKEADNNYIQPNPYQMHLMVKKVGLLSCRE